MSGHSHWSGIKHKKQVTDKKRGKVFGKLLAAVTIAARDEQSPDFNPRLRSAVEKAKEAHVPKERIEGAIARASQKEGGLEEFLFGAYGPGGAAILIEAISDNRNRVVSEVKAIISEHEAKWAEPDSVAWAFQKSANGREATFFQELSIGDKEKLEALILALDEHDDVQRVFTNTK